MTQYRKCEDCTILGGLVPPVVFDLTSRCRESPRAAVSFLLQRFDVVSDQHDFPACDRVALWRLTFLSVNSAPHTGMSDAPCARSVRTRLPGAPRWVGTGKHVAGKIRRAQGRPHADRQMGIGGLATDDTRIA